MDLDVHFVRQKMLLKDVPDANLNGIAKESVKSNIGKITRLFARQFMKK